MAETTGISWCDSTFNPWRGCTKISPGCANCYAAKMSGRNPKVLGIWGNQGARVLGADSYWKQPGKWNAAAKAEGKRRRVFCCSLADVFEDWQGQMTDTSGNPLWLERPNPEWELEVVRTPFTLDNARKRLWQLIKATPWLDWLILTKRPENIGKMLWPGEWPNIWLGTSVESTEYLPRVDLLLDAPQKVPVRFVSAEPLITPLEIAGLGPQGINWVIVGGESGAKARLFRCSWAMHLRAMCS